MNRNLRLAIESAIENRTISVNLCYLCLARLHYVITNRKIATPKQERQRKIIAKALIQTGIDKDAIYNEMISISDSVFPTDKTINTISDMIENNHYYIDNSIIPDRWVKRKSADQIEIDKQKKPVKKKTDDIEQKFYELCFYVEKEICKSILHCDLSEKMKTKLKSMRTSEFDYTVILQTFKRCLTDINKSLHYNNTFKDDYNKFVYVCGIVKNQLPETIKRNEYQKKQEEALDRVMINLSHNTTIGRKTDNDTKKKKSHKNYDTQKYIDKYKDMW